MKHTALIFSILGFALGWYAAERWMLIQIVRNAALVA